ncbi:MAG: hypothetical protein EOP04_15375, partial [Proteobacteria bacterium]
MGLGWGGPKIRGEEYYFSADGDNCFYSKSPSLKGFQMFHLYDDRIEIWAAKESKPYGIFIFNKKKSLKNIANADSGKNHKYKGKDYKLKVGNRGGNPGEWLPRQFQQATCEDARALAMALAPKGGFVATGRSILALVLLPHLVLAADAQPGPGEPVAPTPRIEVETSAQVPVEAYNGSVTGKTAQYCERQACD